MGNLGFGSMIRRTSIWRNGHYVPQLSQVIIKHNSATKQDSINLKGYMIVLVWDN
ncbi:putative peptidase S10, serine carboxypeptidase, alpha/Beta hydrolase [Medicago truncatula]|uniref:Putative peptidase S10, serine carboxypeptidase, alpha/Beta hydrolase n=1 Tax=Medicago truncatula TaxID=3880 RepID=A0A396J9P3_MEDTR|nr:putative peptidase S10, serine carboxypeptidase, alpha/Beta hydrolase [Medicago truncatula]